MGGMTGFNMLHPFAWFASAGDATGDVSHNHAYAPDGNFHNDLSVASGAAHPAGAASIETSATGARYPVGAYATYNNSSLQAPGVQAPVQGGPTLMQGPQQGPWYKSDYAAALPTQYVSAAPPWKNGPMMAASSNLPVYAQAAVHMTGTNPPVTTGASITPAHHTVPPGLDWGQSSGVMTGAGTAVSGSTGGGGGGCGCGCGGGGGRKKSSPCRGTSQQAVGLDSTNDFPPLYSHYQATPNQAINAHLYGTTSTHVPAWATAHGTPGDGEQPLQGQ